MRATTRKLPHGYNELPKAGPTQLDDDWVARTEGWTDDAEKQRCYLDCLALGARIVTDREAIDDAVQCRDEIHDGILDRIAAGTLVIPGTPTPSAIRQLLYRATREVWRNLMAERGRQHQSIFATATPAQEAGR